MRLAVQESASLDLPTRSALRDLWNRAFGDRFSDADAEHAFGGVHVLAFDDARVVAHASAIPRRIRFGDGPWITIGYVEAVAVDPEHRRRGVGSEVMRELHREIRNRWPIAMLSTGGATSFYERLGWERWLGASSTVTEDGPTADGEDQGLMVLRWDGGYATDLRLDVTCEGRTGDAW